MSTTKKWSFEHEPASEAQFLYRPVLSDLPQEHLDKLLNLMSRHFTDLFRRTDIQGSTTVNTIHILRMGEMGVICEVKPFGSKLGPFVPVWVILHVCPDCGCPFEHPGGHPANGCDLGVVENTMLG